MFLHFYTMQPKIPNRIVMPPIISTAVAIYTPTSFSSDGLSSVSYHAVSIIIQKVIAIIASPPTTEMQPHPAVQSLTLFKLHINYKT